MPHLTASLQNLAATGPVLNLMVTVSQGLAQALRARGRPVPAPVSVMAMIDTGAAATVITPAVAAGLAIQPTGTSLMVTPSTHQPVSALQYHVDLVLPNNLTVHGVRAIAAPLLGQHIQCLIGRDVLSFAVLTYLGHANMFVLSF